MTENLLLHCPACGALGRRPGDRRLRPDTTRWCTCSMCGIRFQYLQDGRAKLSWENWPADEQTVLEIDDAKEREGALRAGAAMLAGGNFDPYDPDSTLCDLLTDLMLWADHNDVDFRSALERAERHHGAERKVRS